MTRPSTATSSSAAARCLQAGTCRSSAGIGTTACRQFTFRRGARSSFTSTRISRANRWNFLGTMPISEITADPDPTGHGTMWSARSGSSDRSPLAGASRHLFAAAALAFGAAGSPTSSSPTPVRLHRADGWGRPVVHGSAVYYLTRHHELYAVERSTGGTMWRQSLRLTASRARTSGTTVIVERGTVVVGDDDLFAFDGQTGAPRWHFVPAEGDRPGPYLGASASGV